jgi:hypothetical protein
MQRWKCLFTTATALLALSVSGLASANSSAVQEVVDSMPEVPFVAVTDGETMLLAQANKAKEKEKSGKSQGQAQKAQGYEKSGNPKAAGGPLNPGKGKPQKPSDVRPEQPIEKPKPEQPIETPRPEQPIERPRPEQPIETPKPEQPIEGAKPEQPIAPPQPEPRDKDGIG